MRKPLHQLYAILLATALLGACSDSDSDDPVVPFFLLDSLAAAYSCNGNVDDSVGTAHGVGVGGFTYTDDRFGSASSACSFDGVDSKVNVSSSVSGTGSDGLSVSFWAMTPLASYGGAIIYANGNRFMLQGSIGFTMISGSTNTVVGAFPQNTWSHFVATFDVATDTMKLYRDNVLLDEDLKGDGGYGLNASSLEFGQYDSWGGGVFWTGALDDIQFYDRALTASEVTQLYNLQKP